MIFFFFCAIINIMLQISIFANMGCMNDIFETLEYEV